MQTTPSLPLAAAALSLLLPSPLGGQVRTVLHGSPTPSHMALSGDGRHIFIASGCWYPSAPVCFTSPDLYHMRADGTGLHRLDLGKRTFTSRNWRHTHPRLVSQLSVSADGSKLAFLEFGFWPGLSGGTWRTDYLGAWVLDLATTKPKLVQLTPYSRHRPLISADGRKVVYSAYRVNSGTFIANSDGTGAVGIRPGFRPDSMDAKATKIVGVAGSGIDVYIINTDSTGLRNLTNTPKLEEHYPAISADGKRVAFGRVVGITPNDTTEVMIINADGTGLKSLLKVPGHPSGFYRPRFTGDGKLIAFMMSPGGNQFSKVYLVRADKGGAAVVLTSSSTGFYSTVVDERGTRLLGMDRSLSVFVLDTALPDLKALGPERIGTTETLQVAARPGHGFALALSDTTAAIPLPPFGTLGLDPRRMWVFAQGVVGATSVFRLPVKIPNDPGLVGRTEFFQALTAAPPNLATGALTNVVKIRLQK